MSVAAAIETIGQAGSGQGQGISAAQGTSAGWLSAKSSSADESFRSSLQTNLAQLDGSASAENGDTQTSTTVAEFSNAASTSSTANAPNGSQKAGITSLFGAQMSLLSCASNRLAVQRDAANEVGAERHPSTVSSSAADVLGNSSKPSSTAKWHTGSSKDAQDTATVAQLSPAALPAETVSDPAGMQVATIGAVPEAQVRQSATLSVAQSAGTSSAIEPGTDDPALTFRITANSGAETPNAANAQNLVAASVGDARRPGVSVSPLSLSATQPGIAAAISPATAASNRQSTADQFERSLTASSNAGSTLAQGESIAGTDSKKADGVVSVQPGTVTSHAAGIAATSRQGIQVVARQAQDASTQASTSVASMVAPSADSSQTRSLRTGLTGTSSSGLTGGSGASLTDSSVSQSVNISPAPSQINSSSISAESFVQAGSVSSALPAAEQLQAAGVAGIAGKQGSRAARSTSAVDAIGSSSQHPQTVPGASGTFSPISVPAAQGDGTAAVSSLSASTGASHATAQDTFAALDSSNSAAPTWVHAGQREAEAGFQDPSLGWIGVRADASSSGVHATLLPSSYQASQELGGHLAGLNSYLSEQRTPVETLTLASPGGGDSSPMAGQNANQGMNQGRGDNSSGQSSVESSAIQTSVASSVSSAIAASEAVSWSSGSSGFGGMHISVVA